MGPGPVWRSALARYMQDRMTGALGTPPGGTGAPAGLEAVMGPPAPVAAPQSPSPGSGGPFSTLFGLDPSTVGPDRSAAVRRGLLDTGLALLTPGSDPSAAIQMGRAGAGEVERTALRNRLLGPNSAMDQNTILGLLRGGDTQAAGVLASMPRNEYEFVKGDDNNVQVFNKRTGERVGSYTAGQAGAVGQMPSRVQSLAIESLRSFSTRQNIQQLQQAAMQAQNLRDLLAQAAEGGERGAQAVAVITAFGKLLDPGSVVRESEFANIRNSGSLMTQVENWMSQMQHGTPSRAFLTSMRQAVNQLDANYRQAYQHASDSESRMFRAVTGYDLPLPSLIPARNTQSPAGANGSNRPAPNPDWRREF